MKKTIGLIFAWIIPAAVCIFLLSSTAFAQGTLLGPGDYYDVNGNIRSLDGNVMVFSDGVISSTPGNPYSEAAKESYSGPGYFNVKNIPDTADGINYTKEKTADGQTVYVFEGNKYIAEHYIKEFKLTGYCYESASGDLTRSGKHATSKHTIAAMSSLLNKTILIDGTSGSEAHDYDGIYVVEDTGGSCIESGERLDIWFDSLQEAVDINAYGWNCVDAWVLKPYK